MSSLFASTVAVILDADCTISLAATDRLPEVLHSIPCPCQVSRWVHDQEVLRANLQPCIDRGLLTVVSPERGSEYELTVRIALETPLGDGEGESIAIAFNRGWAIAIDDRRARNFISSYYPSIKTLSTPEILKHWIDMTNPGDDAIRHALQNVRTIGRYEISAQHPLYGWWHGCL